MKSERVGLYARTSTADKGQDPELQLKDLRAYAHARGWKVFGEYVDIGESGAKDRRPQLDRLMEDARKRRIDGILVWKLDRFGRSLKALVTTLEELRSLGVQFVSYTENLDFSTPAGRAMANLIGVFAEFERDLIRERVKAGIQNAKSKGIRVGRRPLIDPGLLRTIADMRSKGMTIRKISKAIRLSRSLVHKTLKILRQETLENQGVESSKMVVL
jgi:DNA invertase Pin-like site-specific DNA recombinase